LAVDGCGPLMSTSGAALSRGQQCWSKKKSLAWQRVRFYKKLGFNPSLEWAAQHLDDVPSRPRRMNQRVYARLVARLDKYGPLAQSAE
jgi:hypothetical protein